MPLAPTAALRSDVQGGRFLQPATVRYAWANNPICNLCNAAGLPASPFRTDDWSRQEVKAGDEKLSEPQ